MKADTFAGHLCEIFAGNSKVRVARPVKMADVRINGLDDSVTPTEVASPITTARGCDKDDVRTGEIRRRSPMSIGFIWLRCPTTSARKIVEAGRILVGWISARVDALTARPLQCYRCLGHVMQHCTSDADRSGRCYTYGATGRGIRRGTAPP